MQYEKFKDTKTEIRSRNSNNDKHTNNTMVDKGLHKKALNVKTK